MFWFVFSGCLWTQNTKINNEAHLAKQNSGSLFCVCPLVSIKVIRQCCSCQTIWLHCHGFPSSDVPLVKPVWPCQNQNVVLTRPSYLYHGNPNTWLNGFHIQTGPRWLQYSTPEELKIERLLFQLKTSRFESVVLDISHNQIFYGNYWAHWQQLLSCWILQGSISIPCLIQALTIWQYFADYIFKCIFLKENVYIFIQIPKSLLPRVLSEISDVIHYVIACSLLSTWTMMTQTSGEYSFHQFCGERDKMTYQFWGSHF